MLQRSLNSLLFLALALLAFIPSVDGDGRNKAYAQEYNIFQPHNVFPVSAGLTVSFLQCNSAVFPDDTTVTLSGLNVGAEAADRVTVIGIVAKDATAGHNFTSVTVGGVAATEVADEAATGEVNSAILIMNNPSGTAEDVTVTISQSSNDAATVCLWRVTGLTELTPKATTVDDDTASAALVLNLADTDTPGFAVGVCIAASDTGATTTWTGLTELVDATDADGSSTYSAAHTTSTDGSALTIGCDWTGTNDASGAVAAFGNSPSPSITFLQCSSEDTSNATTYTFTAQNTGTASSSRYTIIGFHGVDSASAFGVNSITVGGDAASESVDFGASGVSFSQAIYIMANSAGTSEDVVVTLSEGITSARICLWQVNNISSSTATDTASASAGSGGVPNVDLDVSASGVAVAVCGSNTGGGSAWSMGGMSERDDFGAGSELRMAAADYTNDAVADAPLDTTLDPNGSANNSCATASYR